MVLAVPDEPARGRKPVLRDELAAVVFKQQYPPERLRKKQLRFFASSFDAGFARSSGAKPRE
ncbi:MAG: hypothetical protein JXA30_09285 [Deltaproteobacteria bacterium]|nr:hypothetical protein [Deltaproteobacteria bacterium]